MMDFRRSIGCCLVVLELVAAFGASAEDAPPSATSSSSIKNLLQNRKYEESDRISDAKLKADSGSLSQYSLKFNISYYGPTLDDLSAKDQPNPDGSVGTYTTALSGNAGLRYRFDSQRAVSLGTGLKAVHPFHGMERFDVQTPYLSYDTLARADWGLQMRHSVGVSATTLPEYQRIGQTGVVSYDFSSIYNFQSLRLAIGLDGNLSYFAYHRGYQKSDRKASRGAVSVFPTIKYNFSDKLSLVTSTALIWLSPRYRSNETILLNKITTQRLGLGYAYSRDVYIFPYVTAYPTKLAWDTTTVSLSTVFSIL